MIHELGHTRSYRDNPDQHYKDGKTYNLTYGNNEESDVIQRIENPAAKRLGHIIRKHHEGKFYEVKSPTSTESVDD